MYAARKYASEGDTDTLDQKVRRFGVRAILVEPERTKTRINEMRRFVLAGLFDKSFRKQFHHD